MNPRLDIPKNADLTSGMIKSRPDCQLPTDRFFALPVTAAITLFLPKNTSYKARFITSLPWVLIIVLILIILATGPFGHIKAIKYN